MAHVRLLPLALACLAGCPAVAWAGMPRPTSIVLTDLARMRLQNLSFFLAGFLLSALLIQLLWNYLRRDWPVLPRLSYLRAVGLVALWGLLFVLVLTMISGARELLTPGAWEPSGATYRLRDRSAPATGPTDSSQEARRQQMVRLKAALWRYARAHDGRFPESRTDPGVPPERWLLPDESGLHYVYRGGTVNTLHGVPLAYEPEVAGSPRWALFTDGELRFLTADELALALPAEKK